MGSDNRNYGFPFQKLTLVYLINLQHVLINFSKEVLDDKSFSSLSSMVLSLKPLPFARNMIVFDTITLLYHDKFLRWVLNNF